MQRKLTCYFGIFFAVIGIAGLIPALAPANADGQLLLGIFQVNTEQTWIHILSAVAAFAGYAAGSYYSALYLKVFGIVYALVAIWGLPTFMQANYNDVLFGLIHVNLATELLHIAIAAVALYGGFLAKADDTATPKPTNPVM